MTTEELTIVGTLFTLLGIVIGGFAIAIYTRTDRNKDLVLRLSAIKQETFLIRQESNDTRSRLIKFLEQNQPSKRWITDGVNSRLIEKGEEIPEGWRSGRTQRPRSQQDQVTH